MVMTILVALVTSSAGTLIAAYFARPKTKAEARGVDIAADVAISADSREWAQLFVARADRAEERLAVAETRAEHAEERAEHAEERVDELDAAMVKCYLYVKGLRSEVVRLGGHPEAPPADLEALWAK